MNLDEVIVYGFKLGNAHPEFKEFILSLNNTDIHNLRKILYEKKLDSYRDGYGRALYGLDRYGCVAIPDSIRSKRWAESGNEIYPFLKDLWVYTKLGHNGSSFNPIKDSEFKYWRALVATSNDEAKEMIKSTIIDVALQYLFCIGFVKTGSQFIKPAAKQIAKEGQGQLSRDLFDISYRITNPGKYGVARFGKGQMDAGHRGSTFFSDEIIKTGDFGIRDYRTIYFNKKFGDEYISVGINPWKRRIIHEGPGFFK